MDSLHNIDLTIICRMCTSNLVDQECYSIDEELEELVASLTTIKFDHIENKQNLRMCTNCYECLKSFNEFRTNCINIHEKLIKLDQMEKSDKSEEFFVEEVADSVDEIIEFKLDSDEEEMLLESSVKNEEEEQEVVYAIEKIMDSEDSEGIINSTARKSNIKRTDTTMEKGKEIYQKLLHRCEICGKMIEKNRLEGHINKHNDVRPFKCEECNKEFYCKQLLRLHRTTIHTNIKVKCETCDKLFPSARALYAHTLRHKNENRYVCNLCDKKFNNSNSLKRHMAIHSGVREFICTICGVGFYRKFNLDVHVKNVHKQTKEYICEVPNCKKSFGYGRLLKDHQRRCHKNVIEF